MVRGRWIGDRGMVKAPRPIPDEVRARQARASDPSASAFVSANAGSGKTHVLVQRVIRLLLAGVPPEKILCITFTKAAAASSSRARVHHARALGDARRHGTRCGDPRGRHPASHCKIAARRTKAVRLCAGDAGRAQGADHPRAVHAFAPAVSVRGQCPRALRRDRRARPDRHDGTRQSEGAAGGRARRTA